LATRPPYDSGPTDPQEIRVEAAEVRPVGRYEWEQIIRRARLNGAIAGKKSSSGKTTKGAISGTLFKAVALAWASYASPEGDRIFPGDATVSVDLETSLATVRTVRQKLLELGLMTRVRGRRADKGEEYRLTLPADLLERLDVLTPAQHKLAANRVRERARGSVAGLPSGQPKRSGSGYPVDHPNPPDGDFLGLPSGPPEEGSGLPSGSRLGYPVDSHNEQEQDTTTNDHSGEDLRTAVTVSRACEAEQDPISLGVVVGTRPSPAPGPPGGRPPDNRARHRPRPRPIWWAEIEARATSPTDGPGRAAYAAARAALAADLDAAHRAEPEHVPGAAWDALVALTT
jgi:hypothetical protein